MNGQFTISSQIPDSLPCNRLTLEAMKLLRHIITIVCLVATFIANAGEQLTTKPKCVFNQPTNAELQLLHGTWEGVLVGDKAHQKITITITGSSLHFHRDTNVAIFKIEDGTLTLATGNGDGEAPKSFEATGDNGLNRYELRRVQPQKKNAGPPKTK
jgi:hypothetical protein